MSKNYWSALLIITLCITGGILFKAIPQAKKETNRGTLHGPAAVEQLKQDGQFDSLQAAISATRRNVRPTAHSSSGHAVWHAPNAAAGYDAFVSEAGVSLAIDDNAQISLHSYSVGYGRDLRAIGQGEVSGDGQKIQVLRDGGVREWFVNGPDGLEHGFTLSEPPGTREHGVPLRLALQISEGWSAEANDDGTVVTFRAASEQAIEYSKLVVRDDLGRNIPGRLKVDNGRVVIEVEDYDADYPLTIDPLFTLQKRLTASDAASQDYFGHSVALDGNTALIGAPYDDVTNADQGSAYVFVRNGTTWTEQARLTANDGANLDLFGWVVSLDGDTALVGARNGPGLASADQGAAYVFVRQGTSWSQQARLNSIDGVAAGGFGTVLALDGNTALIGAPDYRASPILKPGAAYVFVRNGTAWTHQARLTANDGEDEDQFGAAVAVEDGTAIIGAPADNGTFANQGSAYVFTRNGVLWGGRQRLTGSNPAANDFFGNSVAIDGETALVGAYLRFADDLGIVYVFDRLPTGWTETTTIGSIHRGAGAHFGISVALSGDRAVIGGSLGLFEPGPDQRSAWVFLRLGRDFFQVRQLGPELGSVDDRFGYSVALDGDTVLVGAHRGDVSATDQGAAYTFVMHDNQHVQQQKLIDQEGEKSDYLGVAVALSGDTLVVGAEGDDVGNNANQGSASVYTRSGTVWTLQKKITAGDGAARDFFGCSVAISGDTLVVGARYDEVGNNTDQGSAYVFTRTGTVWTFQQQLKAGANDGAANDNFGGSVAISGETVVVGAPTANNSRGAAYVFTRTGTSWTQQGAKLSASDGADGDEFGFAIALSGDSLVVGAPYAKVGQNEDQGAAYLFTRTGGVWTQRPKLTDSDGAADDRFGCAVAVTDETIVVGALFDTIGNNTRQGSAALYVRSGTAVVPAQKLVAQDGSSDDRFGASLALSNDILVVGAIYDTSGTNTAQGSAYTFTDIGGHWYRQQKLTANDGATQDYFGQSVAVSGELIAVGASGDDIEEKDSQGSAYVFISPACPTLVLAPESLHDGVVNVAYKVDLTTSGGSGAFDYEYSVTAGGLPPGLVLDDFTVRGAPTTPGTYRFTIAAAHSLSLCAVSRDYTVTVTATCPTITIGPATLSTGTVNVSYSQPLMVTGAASPYTLSLEPGSALPPGLSLVNGALAGVPRQAGTFTFMYRVRDVNACTGVQSISVTINPACDISPVTLPAAFQNKPYNTNLTATGGTAPYTFVLTTGMLPPGLSLSPSGVLSGTPTDPGNYRFTISATANGCAGTRVYTLGVGCVAMIVQPGTLPAAKKDVPYTQSLTSSGGAAPYRYTIANGQLPTGLSLSTDGILTGTPTQSGTFQFAVTVQDSGVCAAFIGYTLFVEGEPFRLNLLAPNAVRMGTEGFTLNVVGTGFTTSQRVLWNGIECETSFESATQLRAVIPAELLSIESVATVKILETGNGAQSNQVKFRILGEVAHASAASYNTISLAPDSIVAAFGANLASEVRVAESLELPTELAGTTVKVRDSEGTVKVAPLFFVSPNQINYLMPAALANGAATITIRNGNEVVAESLTEISTAAPGLFSANFEGAGPAAAQVLRVKENGEQVYEPVARYDAETKAFVLVPIDLSNAAEQVFLVLYGTGIRHREGLETVTIVIGNTELPVQYAGPAPPFNGLDQMNVLLPGVLRALGEQTVTLRVNNEATNGVKVRM